MSRTQSTRQTETAARENSEAIEQLGRPSWLHLTNSEQVLWAGHPTRWQLVPTILLSLFIVAGALVLGLVWLTGQPTELAEPMAGFTSEMWLGVFTIVAVLLALTAGVEYGRWSRNWYVITTQEIYHRTGLIAEDVREIRLENIQNTYHTQSITERLFNYGDIGIETSGTDATEMMLENVPDPSTVGNVLATQRDYAGSNASYLPDQGTTTRPQADRGGDSMQQTSDAATGHPRPRSANSEYDRDPPRDGRRREPDGSGDPDDHTRNADTGSRSSDPSRDSDASTETGYEDTQRKRDRRTDDDDVDDPNRGRDRDDDRSGERFRRG